MGTRIKKLHNLIKGIDWSRLEKSLLLRGLDNNIDILRKSIDEQKSANNLDELEKVLLTLPNYVHPKIYNYGNKMKEIYQYGSGEGRESRKLEFADICKYLNIFRMDHLGNYTGHKSYYLFGNLAELEQALIQYTIDVLKENSFNIISVPDILPEDVINGCGMQTDGDRTQVYKIESGRCLSGTSEMALGGFFSNKLLTERELPLKYAAVSRCYRAETSGLSEEKGIYRVHQFNKVEMFCVCTENQSEDMLECFKDLQMDIFKKLNLKFRLMDMPANELGDPAYQKYDIEAWMPGRQLWGEISSCSNCTDYQSKRLNIEYTANNEEVHFAHTINGTASAIPRLLIALVESNQTDKNTVKMPDVLKTYLRETEIIKQKRIPEIKLVKHIK